MPRRPRTRRNRPRRNLPPAPTVPGAPQTSADLQPSRRARIAASERPRRLVERDAPFLAAELRRIGVITAACFGLLLLLVLADRLS